MLKRSFGVAFPVAALLGSVLLAKPGAYAQQSPSSPTGTMVHLEGCVYTEQAITSKQPATIPPAGTHTYVLINATLIAGSVSEEEVAKTSYTLEKVEQDQLRLLNGQRVGVTGRITKAPARPKLEVVDIRDISGGCPAIPTIPNVS